MTDQEYITLPNYEVEPCYHNCPWCGGVMKTVVLDLCQCVGFDRGTFVAKNVRVYRCVDCAWERTPSKSFDIVREVLNEKTRNPS